jgi:hypothetical protein
MSDLSQAYSCWLVCSGRQRPEHLASQLRIRSHCYGFIHITVQKWDTIPCGSTAFFEIYEAIKSFEHKYPDYAEKYTIIIHGRANCPSKSQIRYIKGATIHYTKFTGELKISHINRSIRPLVDLVKTASSVCSGAHVEVKKLSSEEILSNARKRMLQKRVLSSNRY